MNTALATPLNDRFSLTDKVVIISGGAGTLGREHAAAVVEARGTALIADADFDGAVHAAREVDSTAKRALPIRMDVTDRQSCKATLQGTLDRFGRIDVLVNSAPFSATVTGLRPNRFENQSVEDWEADLAVGLRGTFLCSQVFGGHMANHGGGVIVNVASDLGVLEHGQGANIGAVAPISHSVIKGGLILMTRYLATYWTAEKVRVNALCPGGVFAGQPERFVERLTNLIPLGRMAKRDEYRAALVFLATEASSYMTGSTLVMDGGRACS